MVVHIVWPGALRNNRTGKQDLILNETNLQKLLLHTYSSTYIHSYLFLGYLPAHHILVICYSSSSCSSSPTPHSNNSLHIISIILLLFFFLEATYSCHICIGIFCRTRSELSRITTILYPSCSRVDSYYSLFELSICGLLLSHIRWPCSRHSPVTLANEPKTNWYRETLSLSGYLLLGLGPACCLRLL